MPSYLVHLILAIILLMTFAPGMEVAASLVTSAASVTVIGRDTTPFMASLGEQVPGGGRLTSRALENLKLAGN